MKTQIDPNLVTKLQVQFKLRHNTATLLASLDLMDRYSTKDLSELWQWNYQTVRNQIEVLKDLKFIDKYPSNKDTGKTIYWGITQKGYDTCQELSGTPVVENMNLSTDSPSEPNLQLVKPLVENTARTLWGILNDIPEIVAKHPWFKEAVLSRLDLDNAA